MENKIKYSFSITSNGYDDSSYSIYMRCWEVDSEGNIKKDIATESYNYLTLEQCFAYQITFQNR